MGIPLAVLHVEDVEDDHLLVMRTLAQGGYDVKPTRFETPEQMRQALAAQPWDIILCDHKLPKFDSFGALQVLKESGLDLPFIIVSGSIVGDVAVEAMRVGAQDFIFKNNLTRLVPAVQRELHEAEGRRAHRQAEAAAQQWAKVFEYAQWGVAVSSGDGKRVEMMNPAFAELYGYTMEELTGKPVTDLFAPAARLELPGILQLAAEHGHLTFETLHIRKDGTTFPAVLDITVVNGPDGKFGYRIVNCRDITERKQAEAAVRESQARFQGVVNSAVEAIVSIDDQQRVILFNPGAEEVFGYSAAEALGLPLVQFLPAAMKESHPHLVEDFGMTGSDSSRHMGKLRAVEGRRHDGTLFPAEVNISKVGINGGTIYTAIIRDITERKQAEQKTLSHLRRLAALRAIDVAISSTFDLRVTLNFLLGQVILQLGVDAAAVLLLDRDVQELTCAGNQGFRSNAINGLRLRLGQDYAGQAALERRSIYLPNLTGDHAGFSNPGFAANEGFVAYYAVPLIAKGQVKGVLEIFNRSTLDPDSDWTDFLETLAGQTAIAVDNAELFGDLQQSNAEMQMAYDRTIEGWSRAMDLRDKETEGHTLRVAEMTLELCRKMQVKESELAHVRRGGLLHDMGKLGIPDSILLKPGPLTDDEWVIMRKHPTYAYEMLSPIEYLRPALDIPYCHHEKWDGTGYPRGLKGHQIPFAARIFAVVDVWDALSSDRPYRLAWPKEKVREYISSLSGTHFDPQVVDVFLRTLEAT